jgi:hypothetical protein
VERQESQAPREPDSQRIDRDELKALYDSSKHVAWAPFAVDMKLDPVRSKQHYPAQVWVAEKRERIATEVAQKIQVDAQLMKGKLAEDVINTLSRYPKFHDQLFDIAAFLENELKIEANQLVEERKAGKKNKKLPAGFFYRFESLTRSIKQLTESKYRSILLGSIKLKEISIEADKDATRGDPENVRDLKFTVMGFENMNEHDMQKIYDQYFDKRQALPPPAVDVSNPEDEGNA